MDALRSMAIFATVVEQGSMRAAARVLGITPSAVSQQIAQLERDCAVTLLYRTTRKLTLTEAGQMFYDGCADMLAAARRARTRLAELRDTLNGELRMTAPVGFVGRMISDALAPLLAANPGLTLTLIVSDERIDLVGERIDLALRVGQLEDSTLIARQLARCDSLLVASPTYLARHPPLLTPEQLVRHTWLLLDVGQGAQMPGFSGPDGQTFTLRVEPRVRSNNILQVRSFTCAGLGLSVQPETEIRNELARGELVRVLPGWSLPQMGIYAVTPRRDAQPAKVRHAIAALQDYFARQAG